MPSALQRIVQSDYAAGIQPSVARHLIDPQGVYDIVNGLLDDDGMIYRRGGATYQSNAAFGAVGIRFIWDGYLDPGHRTVIANTADFAVLNPADNATPINLGGVGLTASRPAVEIEGMLFIAGPTSYIYGGSLKTAAYTTGTVTTGASKVVTGSGTSWLANLDAGMLFQTAASERVYVIASVDSDTQITLRDTYEGSAAGGKTYQATPLYQIAAADPYEQSNFYAVAGNRLLRVQNNRVYFAGLDTTNSKSLPHSWSATDYHAFPYGVTVLGLNSIGDAAVALTSGGIWLIQGLSYDLVDDFGNLQHRLDNVNRDIVLWGNEGVAGWLGALVIPGQDAVYLLEPSAGITMISASINSAYREYVCAGYHPGKADVFHNHYFLPILDSSEVCQDVLICRLDKPGRIRNQVAYPWTRADGTGAALAGVAVSRITGTAPKLLGAQAAATARVLNLTDFFHPDAAVKNDPDGSTHNLRVITRDYLTGELNLNRLRRVRAHYDLQATDPDAPRLHLEYATPGLPPAGTLWGHFQWGHANWSPTSEGEFVAVEGEAPDTIDGTPYTWHVNKRVREVRLRIRSSGPCVKLNLRHLMLFVAPSQQVRN